MATPVPTLVGSIVENASDGSISIPNTTPPAVGDYLVACIAAYQSGGSRNISSAPAGWTGQQTLSGDDNPMALYTKRAEAADVAAGSFTFTISGIADSFAGAVIKITNIPSGAEIAGSEQDVGTSSFTATTSLAATTPQSIAVAMYVDGQNSSGGGTFSAYTSSPSLTWNEIADLPGNNGAPSLSLGVATAVNSGTSSITSRGVTFSGTPSQAKSIMILLNARNDATATHTLLEATPTFHAPTAQAGTTGTHSHLAGSPTFHAPTASETSPTDIWTEQTKSTTTWTNETK